MLTDDDYFYLRIGASDCALEYDDPSHHAYSTRGDVIALDDEGNEILAGKFHLYYLDVAAALNANVSVFDIFDCRTQTVDYFTAIFDPDTLDTSEKLLKLFKYPGGWGNVLILDRLEILPGFRGHNLGLVVMRRLIERFGAGAFLVAIKPFPLQHENKSEDDAEWRSTLQLAELDKDLRRATAKLRRHYAKLGFKALKGTPFMFLATDYPLPRPDTLKK